MDLLCDGELSSGVYTIYPSGDGSTGIQVWCDQQQHGGGWTVCSKSDWNMYLAFTLNNKC